MSSADMEIQNEELDALSSILDGTVFEINRKSSINETTYGTLIVEVTLPDVFHITYHLSIDMTDT